MRFAFLTLRAESGLRRRGLDAERGNEYSNMIARLKPGVTLAAVQRDLDLIQARNAQRLPEEAPFWKTSVT